MTEPSKSKHTYVKGFKYRLYPNKEQTEKLNQILGCTRFVYNHLLAECQKEYEAHKASLETDASLPKPNVSKFGLGLRIKPLRNDPQYPWLKEIAFDTLRISAHHLSDAFIRFFKEKKGYPQFKSRYSKQSATFSQIFFGLKDNKLKLCLVDSLLKVSWNRPLPSVPKSVTLSRTPSGKYYASFLCECEKVWLPQSTEVLGIDVGLKHYAALSTGEKIENPRAFIKYQKKLKRAQQSLARKLKGSANRAKARLKVAKIHEKIKNTRETFQHQLSRKLVNNFGVLCLEALKVKNMIKNKNLAKHIADAAWSSFRDKVKYKVQEAHNRILALADSKYPSTQLCSTCGVKSEKKVKLGVSSWTCVCCNTQHDRDTNAGLNLKNGAQRALQGILPGNQIVLFSY